MQRLEKMKIYGLLSLLVILSLLVLPAIASSASALSSITLIPSEEDTALTTHILALDTKTLINENNLAENRINNISSQGGLAIIAHPKASTFTTFRLQRMSDYLGIEIYNAEVAESYPILGYAADIWDAINSYRVAARSNLIWGFAVDDAHQATDFGRAYVMAKASNGGKDYVLSALRNGSFYATTGALIDDIKVVAGAKGSIITITLPQSAIITFIQRYGVVVAKTSSPSFSASYAVKGYEGYIRVEVQNSAGTAWTQPLRVTSASAVSNPYDSQGTWYKGSVHCHTTNSDGQWIPAQVVDWHAQHGYSFLAITDHNKITALP